MDTLTSRRFSNWSIATWAGISYPLSGLGSGSYFCEASNFARSKGLTHTLTDNATNLYLNVFAELGIIALVSLVIVFTLLLTGQVRRINQAGGPKHREVSKFCFLIALLVAFTVGPHITLFVLMALTMTFLGLTAADIDGDVQRSVRYRTLPWKAFGLLAATILVVGISSWLTSNEIAPKERWEELRWPLKSGFLQEQLEKPEPVVIKNHDAVQPESFTLEIDLRTGVVSAFYHCVVSMGWGVADEYSWAVWVHNNRLQFNSSPDGRTGLGVVAQDTEIESDRNYSIRIAYESSGDRPRAEIWINGSKQRTRGSDCQASFQIWGKFRDRFGVSDSKRTSSQVRFRKASHCQWFPELGSGRGIPLGQRAQGISV